jgi:hypothetical protein
MSKQTAVEWLVEQMKLDELFNADYFIQQAKQMEKEQIIEAHISGMEFIAVDPNKYVEDAEQYYNETYKKEER